MTTETVLCWALPALLFVIAVILLYMYGTWNQNTWKRQGIPGPEPIPFFGNSLQTQKQGIFQSLQQWRKEYGQTYGTYFFRCPMLVTDDVDILKEVMIKDFNNFIDRDSGLPLQRPIMAHNIVNVTGDVWRRQRHTLTPTFSASKLKQMSRFISCCCDNLVNYITKAARAGKPLDVKRAFGCYTLDVIAGTGFGLETNTLENDNNAFLAAVLKVFAAFSNKPRLVVVVAFLFPFLEPFIKKLGITNSTAHKEIDFIEKSITQLIVERKETGKGHVDLLQLMLDSEATEEHVKKSPNDKCLTTEEILAQSLVLFLAGYETTGTLLQYMSYCLAMHPDVQEKLHDKVVAAIGDEEPSYESVSKISYLESCIYETLRMYPPVPMFSRLATNTRTIKGVTIRKGEGVIASVYTLTRDEGFYPQPETFNPGRFDEGGCSSHVPTIVKEIPFGLGPRQCIGMRLALYEAKMAMAAIVRKVKFVRIPETPIKINFKSSRLSAPDQIIFVGVELRK